MSFRLDRFELKFVITRTQSEEILLRLKDHMRADANAVEGARYPIVSVYYDNADRDCYWEKEWGVPSRRKLRVRIYGNASAGVPASTFVEIKHKSDGRGVKRRCRLPLDEAYWISAGNAPRMSVGGTESRLIAEVHDLVRNRHFQPCMAMRYDREAFADKDPASDLRVTFDSNITYRFDRLQPVAGDTDFEYSLLAEGHSVMEVKVTGTVPYWLSRLIGESGCILRGHSKYSNALEAHDPLLTHQLGNCRRVPRYAVASSTQASQLIPFATPALPY